MNDRLNLVPAVLLTVDQTVVVVAVADDGAVPVAECAVSASLHKSGFCQVCVVCDA